MDQVHFEKPYFGVTKSLRFKSEDLSVDKYAVFKGAGVQSSRYFSHLLITSHSGVWYISLGQKRGFQTEKEKEVKPGAGPCICSDICSLF